MRSHDLQIMAALKKQQAELQGKVSEADRAREAAEERATAAEDAVSAAAAQRERSAEEGAAMAAALEGRLQALEAAARTKDLQLSEAEERLQQAQSTATSPLRHPPVV